MKFRNYGVLLLLLLRCTLASSQDFSNKGKEFWLSYSYHVGMVNPGGYPTMTLYLTSDLTTNYTVEAYGVTTIQSGTISAGQVVTVNIPTSYFINDEGLFSNRAIRITGDNPLVVYSYITRNAASGATLCLPVNVLGKEYYSTNFTQVSNEANSNSFFNVIAVEDNTTVEITPSADTKNGWLANTTHSVNLNKGQIYQVLGATSGNNGNDLTGSHIRSVASGTGGCKRIAVFSGSGKIRIAATPTSCPASTNSSDNLYQQLYPAATWGKKYLTVPSYSRLTNIYRVIKSDPATNVYVNGTLIPAASFTNNRYYQFYNTTPNLIESDQPVSVAQYFTTENCDNNRNPYDPDMIMLNPVEQNIDKVTLVSSNLVATPGQHHIHVIMHNGGTGMSSFTLDGAPVPASSWVTHPADPNYSYLYLSFVSQGYHRLASDSGFNAIAYGYAPAETYGYSAGANVKDLYQFVTVQNQFATVSYAATCRNAPFFFSMVFPYQPTEIDWQFNGLFPDVSYTSPVYDSSWTVNGKQLYRYKIPTPYSIPTIGTYPIKVLAQNPTSDGCSGTQEIDYDLQVFEKPHADFSFTASGCVSDTVRFTDNANTYGSTPIKWNWDFGDNTTDVVRNPNHLYHSPGSFTVHYFTATDIGCLSDTAVKTVVLNQPPVAQFAVGAPSCAGNAVTFTDQSTVATGNIVKWTWDFGDGAPVTVATTGAMQTHNYASAGTYAVKLTVESATGCKSLIDTQYVVVHVKPAAAFSFGHACLPNEALQFTNTSTISDGTGSQLGYQWSFGDNTQSTQATPQHLYQAPGPFNVKLVVTAASGCQDSITQTVNTVYAQPQASFPAVTEVCLGSASNFTDQSTAPNSTVTQWNWDFGDGTAPGTQQNPVHTYATAGPHAVTLTVTSAIGCVSAPFSRTVMVNALPTADFTVSDPSCANGSITFTDASVPNAGTIQQWNWDLGDGTVVTRNSSAPVTHAYATAGNYMVTLQVQTDKGCSSSVTSKPLVVHPLPVADFSVPDNCISDVYSQFHDQSTIADGSAAQFSYAWDFGDAAATPSNPNTSTVKDPQHKYTLAGNYQVRLTVSSGAGCSATQTKTFSVNGAVPQSAFVVNGGAQQCSGSPVGITNNSTVDVGRLVKLEIFWDDGRDPSNKTVVSYPVSGAVYNHTYPAFTSPATINYNVRVVAYSGDQCLNGSMQTVTLKALPDVVFGALPSVCANVPAFQITQAQVSNLTGNGVFSGAGVTASGLFNPATATTGQHTITYTFTGSNGCVSQKDQTIEVFAVPQVDAGPDRFVLEGGSAVLSATASGNGLSYLWNPSTYLNDPAILQPVTTPTADISYTLQVTTADGCTAADRVNVQLLKMPLIPNTFSPNGDGIHDRWEIQYLDSYPGATVEIYNRYGQLLFQSVGYSKPWDGSFKGSPLPAGTYYYIINPKNGRKPISGFVDIIR